MYGLQNFDFDLISQPCISETWRILALHLSQLLGDDNNVIRNIVRGLAQVAVCGDETWLPLQQNDQARLHPRPVDLQSFEARVNQLL